MKKFSVPCFFNGVKSPFTIYLGSPEATHHPLHFQADWLSKERGGNIPQEIMDSIAKLKELADKNNVSFEELCVYALGAASQEGEESEDTEEAYQEDEQYEEAAGQYEEPADQAYDNTQYDEHQEQYEQAQEQSSAAHDFSEVVADLGQQNQEISNEAEAQFEEPLFEVPQEQEQPQVVEVAIEPEQPQAPEPEKKKPENFNPFNIG